MSALLLRAQQILHQPRWWWVAVGALAVAASARAALLALGSAAVVEGTDAAWYDLLGWNLLQGRGLSLAQNAPYTPTMYREPGYPALIAVVYAVVGRTPQAVTLLQAGLLGGLVVMAALVGRRVGGAAVGLGAAALTAFSPDQADVARQLLSETAFTALLLGIILLALRARQTTDWRLYALVGLLFGLTTLLRVQAQLLMVLLLPLWLLADRLQFRQWRWRELALVGVVATLVVVPWMLRNQAELGKLSLTQRAGAALLPRGVRSTYDLPQTARWYGQAAWMALNPWSAAVVPYDRFQYGRQYWENDIWDFHLTLSTKAVAWGARACEAVVDEGPQALDRYLAELPIPVRSPLPANGWQAKLEDCGVAVGLRLIRENPVTYLLHMPLEWVKLNFYPLPSRLSAVRNTLTWLAYVTVFVLAVRGRLHGDALWLVLLVGAYNAQAMAADPAERYAVPILPLYYLFAALGLLAAGRWLLTRREVRQAARTVEAHGA